MKTGLGSRFVLTTAALWAAIPGAYAQRTITADVVALDQAFYNNRIGAFQAGGMIFALRVDVVNNPDPTNPTLTPGHVMPRADKRARPIALRMNAGYCMQVNFQTLLADVPSQGPGASLPFVPTSFKTSPQAD